MARGFSGWAIVGFLMLADYAAAQDVNMAAGGSELIWRGAAANAAAGGSLDQGNVGPDNRRDLIVGAPGAAGDPGKVYVIFGGPIRQGELSLTAADVVLHGGTGADRFGAATAAGNIRTIETATTPRDLVVGAPNADGGKGIVYLFAAGSGFPSGAVRRATNAGGADGYAVRIIGRAGDQLGAALATGDVDNDGYRDMIVGAPGTARVYIIRGGTGNPAGTTIDLSVQAPLAEIFATGAAPDQFGRVLAAGDVTGDGRSDLFFGVPQHNGLFMLAVGPAGLAGTINLATSATALFTGVAAGDLTGASVALPDFDGDGTRDLAIGAPLASPGGRSYAGAVYVFWGGPSLASRNAAAANATLWGETPGSWLGTIMVAAGVNRDAPDDLVMLASGARGGQGELHMYYGGRRTTRTGTFDLAAGMARRLFADPSAGPIKSAVVFEVTGEGARDVIAGVPSATGPAGANAGLVYFSISPRLRLSPQSTSLRASRTGSRTASLQVLNLGIGTVTWTASSNVPGITISPASGQSSAGAQGLITVTAPATTPFGRTTATITVTSTSIDLTMTLNASVSFVSSQAASDYDGDGRAEIGVYRPSSGTWFTRYSSNGYSMGSYSTYQWGLSSDVPLQADFDGDGHGDLVVYRPSSAEWFVRYSSDGFSLASYVTFQWGIAGDLPLAADFDGDSRTDLAVYRPSNGNWYIRYSGSNYSYNYATYQWGVSGDKPILADFDADGKTDLVIYRPSSGEWWIRFSSAGYSLQSAASYQWGFSGDTPIAGDFDGDGRPELTIYRPTTGEWFIRFSTSGYSLGDWMYSKWGTPGDSPFAADFDGDGKADLSVYRPSTGEWFIRYSSNGGYGYATWGLDGDLPLVSK